MSKYSTNIEKQINFLKEVLRIQTSSKILDLGCGQGAHLVEIQKLAPDSIGCDNINQSNLTNFKQIDIFNESLGSKNYFDGIYCLAPYFGKNWWNIECLLTPITKPYHPLPNLIQHHIAKQTSDVMS